MQFRSGSVSGDVKKEFDENKPWVQLGFYYENLKRNLEIFEKKNNKIVLFDDLKSNTEGVMNELFEFLEVSTDVNIDYGVKHNKGFVPKSKFVNSLFNNRNLKKKVKPFLPEIGVQVARNIKVLNKAKMPEFPESIQNNLAKLYKEDILKTQDLVDKDLSVWLGAQ
jgi:enoyl-[acyl-carrier-protein] reductase (NADH)